MAVVRPPEPTFLRRDRSVVAPQGVLYCAYGEGALGEAAVSAESYRRHNAAPCALFTDDTAAAQALGQFDFVFPLEPFEEFRAVFADAGRTPATKLFCLLGSPFERTLYVDADSYVRDDLSEAFDLLGHFDILLSNEALTEIGKPDVPGGKPPHLALKKLSVPMGFNAGVFGYSTSGPATEFIRVWIGDFVRKAAADPHGGNWGGVSDQVCLNSLFWEPVVERTGITHAILPNYVYNATDRMLPELQRIGCFHRVRIIHSHLCAEWLAAGNDIESLPDHPELARFRLG